MYMCRTDQAAYENVLTKMYWMKNVSQEIVFLLVISACNQNLKNSYEIPGF